MREAEEETSQGLACASEAAWTRGRDGGDDGDRGSVRGALIIRGSGNTPLCRSVCARGSGGEWHSCASNKGRTRGTYGTCRAAGGRGM